ncbi:MAG: hypothetical protein Q8T04_21315 [Bacteroidota bacterium]|nr:hypothetical protein [Bacteroidota bacterium]
MKRSPFIIWFVLLVFLINSCNLDNLDFEKLSKTMNLSPEFVAPVAKANITVWDLIQSANKENEDVITKDQNGLIKIVYKQNDLFNYNVRDFLDFPGSQSFSSGNKVLGDITPDDVKVSRNISLNELISNTNGALNDLLQFNGMTIPFPSTSITNIESKFSLDPITDFTSITLSKGSLGIVMENKLKVPIAIQGNLFDIGNNRVITEFTFTNIAPGEKKSSSASLAGKQLSNIIEFRLTSFATTGSTTPVTVNLTDYFKMDFNLSGLGISQGNLIIKNSQTLEGTSDVFKFDFPEPDLKAFSAVLKKGTILVKTTNTSKMTGSVNLTLNEIKKNGVPLQINVPLSGSSTTIDLAGANINFASDPVVPYNQIPYVYSLTVNSTAGYINYSATDIIKMDITLNGLEFKSITGDFGKRAITVDPDVFDLNVDMLDKIDGSFKLANPSLVLTIRNSIGMPAKVDLDFIATNKDGKTVALDPQVFTIPVPANINAGIATKTIVFNKDSSNIVDFIALPPTGQISYSGNVNFNPSATLITPQNPNFLDIDATFAIDMAMELPLELQISNLAFKDTSGINGSDYDKIESAELILNAKNGIPLDIDMQLIFIDTLQNIQFGASKKTKILSAAQVNSSGVITPVQSSQTFSLNAVEMENLRKANGIVFSGTVSSPSGGTVAAPIMSDSKLEMNVVIKAKVNL